jgi:(S)-3,5-dihydroxyphenylglycine transaminase
MFAYDGERLPTLKSLDCHGSVIYIGSYSKTLFPGLRLGYLVADQKVAGSVRTLAQELSKVKSLITVNSPALCQGIVAIALRRHGNSLEPIVAPKRAQFRRNRDAMIESLERKFAGDGEVQWNRPRGGFFLTLDLGFEFGAVELKRCASDYGVIVCPLSFLSLSGGFRTQIRLSFSYVTEEEISEGVRRLARFCREHGPM